MICFIGIDIGTTHTKAVIVTGEGKIVFEARQGYDLLQPQPGYEEQDAVAIMAAAEAVMKQAIHSVSEKDTIAAVSFSAAMHSIMPVDEHGEPLYHAIIWADTRSKKEAAGLSALPVAELIIRNTGIPIHPVSPLCKILWIKQNQPAIFSKSYKFISIKEYILYRLFGKYMVDHSVASATGLFNVLEKKWEVAALQAAGINEEKLSAPVSPLHTEYELTDYYKDFFGLKTTVPFVIGASDGCLANLGSGAVLHGETALTIGTSGAVRMTLQNASAMPAASLFTYVLAENLYVRGGAINNGGIVLQWLNDLFFNDDWTAAGFDNLLHAAKQTAPGADGLLFLPYLLGERAPVWDAGARGVLTGLTIRHRKGHIVRAALEGICFTLKQVLQLLEAANGEVKEIFVSGGFIRSPFWIQLLADITGKKLNVADVPDASATGAAYLGMYATGHVKSFSEIKKFTTVDKIYEPDGALYKFYSERFRIFSSLYPKLKEV